MAYSNMHVNLMIQDEANSQGRRMSSEAVNQMSLPSGPTCSKNTRDEGRSRSTITGASLIRHLLSHRPSVMLNSASSNHPVLSQRKLMNQSQAIRESPVARQPLVWNPMDAIHSQAVVSNQLPVANQILIKGEAITSQEAPSYPDDKVEKLTPDLLKKQVDQINLVNICPMNVIHSQPVATNHLPVVNQFLIKQDAGTSHAAVSYQAEGASYTASIKKENVKVDADIPKRHLDPVNLVIVCTQAQDAVAKIVAYARDIFTLLADLSPPNGTNLSVEARAEMKSKLDGCLGSVRILFRRLRLYYQLCKRSRQIEGMEYVDIGSLIPLEDQDTSKYDDKKESEAYKKLSAEKEGLKQEVVLRNTQLKEVIDLMRRTVYDVNVLLETRKS